MFKGNDALKLNQMTEQESMEFWLKAEIDSVEFSIDTSLEMFIISIEGNIPPVK